MLGNAESGSRIDDGCYSGSVSFTHTGKSDVYITGYKTVTSLLDDERGYSGSEDEDIMDGGTEFDDSDDESDDDESESDEEEAPQGVPLLQRKGGDEFSSSDEDEDDESESDEEEEEMEGDGGRAPRTPAGTKRPLSAEGESSGADDADDADDADEIEDEGEQRAAAPPAGKKAKQAGSEPAEAKAYASSLKAFLKAHGPTKLGALGAAVKRPASLPKLTSFLAGRGDFKVDGEQRVSLLH